MIITDAKKHSGPELTFKINESQKKATLSPDTFVGIAYKQPKIHRGKSGYPVSLLNRNE